MCRCLCLDSELSNNQSCLANTIDLDDLEFDENLNANVYPCRCGDVFVVEDEAIVAGYEVFNCRGCSMNIRVEVDDL